MEIDTPRLFLFAYAGLPCLSKGNGLNILDLGRGYCMSTEEISGPRGLTRAREDVHASLWRTKTYEGP